MTIDTTEMTMGEMHKAMNSRALNVAQAYVDLKRAQHAGSEVRIDDCKRHLAYCEAWMTDLAEAIVIRSRENAARTEAGKLVRRARGLVLSARLEGGSLRLVGTDSGAKFAYALLNEGHDEEKATLLAYLRRNVNFNALIFMDDKQIGTWTV